MYVLYLYTLSFILFTLYNCFSKNRNKNTIKKLDYKKNYSFIIKNIEFFKNEKCIEFTNYNNNYYFKQSNIELNVNFPYDYDFFVVNYIYDNKEYKYYSENSFLTFPMYSSEQIKNYVYINKISSAKLLITINKKDEISSKDKITSVIEIDILPMLVQFVGPNYNFYKDLEVLGSNVTSLNKIMTYLKLKNEIVLEKLDIENKNYKLILYDNFNNEYNIDSNYLTWNPELKL